MAPEVTSCSSLLSVENRASGRAAAEARNLWLARVMPCHAMPCHLRSLLRAAAARPSRIRDRLARRSSVCRKSRSVAAERPKLETANSKPLFEGSLREQENNPLGRFVLCSTVELCLPLRLIRESVRNAFSNANTEQFIPPVKFNLELSLSKAK